MIKSGKLLIVIFAIVAVVGVGIYSVSQAIAQDQYEDDLAKRLELSGVPVIEVKTIKRIPYQVLVRLQSSSNDEYLTIDDNWFMQLTRRETALSYRYGPSLKSYRLEVLNSKGEVVHSEENFLSPSDISQQLTPLGESKLNNEETQKIIVNELSLSGLELKNIEVSDHKGVDKYGQVLLIEVVASDIETANNSINSFMGSVMRITDTINNKYGTSLILCHVVMTDLQGNVLLDYVKNIDTRSEQWKMAEGIDGDWFPHPESPSLPQDTSDTSGEIYPPPIENTPTSPYPGP